MYDIDEVNTDIINGLSTVIELQALSLVDLQTMTGINKSTLSLILGRKRRCYIEKFALISNVLKYNIEDYFLKTYSGDSEIEPSDIFDIEALYKRLETTMTVNNMTISEMSRKTGVSRGTFGSMFSKRTDITIGMLYSICCALDVSPDLLVYGKRKYVNHINENIFKVKRVEKVAVYNESDLVMLDELGERLKLSFNHHSYSQEDIDLMIGRKFDYRTGITFMPSFNSLIAYSSLTGISVDYLLGQSDDIIRKEQLFVSLSELGNDRLLHLMRRYFILVGYKQTPVALNIGGFVAGKNKTIRVKTILKYSLSTKICVDKMLSDISLLV